MKTGCNYLLIKHSWFEFSLNLHPLKLDCENLEFETEEDIIEKIVSKLVEKYPEDYGENGELWLDIETCSQSGSSPDGIETVYRPTQWIISNGNYGQRI